MTPINIGNRNKFSKCPKRGYQLWIYAHIFQFKQKKSGIIWSIKIFNAKPFTLLWRTNLRYGPYIDLDTNLYVRPLFYITYRVLPKQINSSKWNCFFSAEVTKKHIHSVDITIKIWIIALCRKSYIYLRYKT